MAVKHAIMVQNFVIWGILVFGEKSIKLMLGATVNIKFLYLNICISEIDTKTNKLPLECIYEILSYLWLRKWAIKHNLCAHIYAEKSTQTRMREILLITFYIPTILLEIARTCP